MFLRMLSNGQLMLIKPFKLIESNAMIRVIESLGDYDLDKKNNLYIFNPISFE